MCFFINFVRFLALCVNSLFVVTPAVRLMLFVSHIFRAKNKL